MDRFTKFAISRARFTWLLIIATLVAGTAVYFTQPRQEDPEITIRSAQVITRFPGLSPERIEALITRPIEEKIKEIPAVKDIRSVSMNGLSIVTPEVDDRYTDMAPIWAQLRDKMDDLRPHLPEGVKGPVVNDDYGRLAVVTLALTGANFSMAELKEMAEDLRDELGALPLVARVELHGVQDERIWLKFDPNFLAQFGLTTASVVESLRGQNVILPGGTVNAAGQRVVIQTSGDFRSLRTFATWPFRRRRVALSICRIWRPLSGRMSIPPNRWLSTMANPPLYWASRWSRASTSPRWANR